jgi:hypothetical protein
MPPIDPFEQHKVKAFYHFTDKQNLASIRKAGGLYSLAELRRRNIVVPKPGGNQWSHDADAMFGVDDYVHLCMRESHPMEYQAKKNGHIGDTLFLEIDPENRHVEGVMYAPDVSNKSGVSLMLMDDALESIDFEVLYTKTDWKDAAIKARLQLAGKCEILIPKHVPLKYIRNMPNG